MRMGRWHVATAVVGVALAASVSSLGNGFTYDDRPLIADNARVHSISDIPRLFGQTYWPESNGAALYRPLTLSLFAIQWTVGNGSPRPFHALNVLLYAAVCAVVAALLMELLQLSERFTATPRWTRAPGESERSASPSDPHALLPRDRWIALAAATLFAAHPVHVEAVGNVVGQSELVVALLLALGSSLYIRHRRNASLTPGAIALLGALYLAACMAKEHAVVFPALLIAAELTVLRNRDAGGRWQTLLTPIVLLAVIGSAFIAGRAWVVGGFSGEYAHLAWGDATFADRVLTMFRVVPEWLRLLLWPAKLSADYSPREIEVVREVTSAVFTGIIVAGAVVTATVLSWRRWPLIAFGILWAVIALLPVSNILVLSGVLLAERTLFLASIGVAIVIAGALKPLMMSSLVIASRWLRAVSFAVIGILVVVGTARSAARQRVWRDNPTFFAQLLEDAPLSYRAHWARGAQLFDAGKKPEGETELRLAVDLFPRDPDLLEDLANRYLRGGYCSPAIQRYRQVLAIVPDRSSARVGLVACLMKNGEHRAAAAEARTGLRFGRDSVQLNRLAHVADSLSRATP